jgi:hypothetical protein
LILFDLTSVVAVTDLAAGNESEVKYLFESFVLRILFE